ncbi:MAG: formylglycine-generating enzyme family protein, partial [Moorea sp. SIO4E2]|uniref:formylglycine-generating enzyme family protein n=1 Tax=Moorena sp. SIO4E2 TaxID=2607826 RepID=UPI0013BDE122
ESREAIPIKVPAAVALRNSLALGRALRPLMGKVPSAIETILDEEATVYQIAESNIWLPVLKPASERWLELALVVEKTSSTAVWKQTITELQNLVKHHGAFRDVRTWELRITETKVNLFPQTSTGCYNSTPHPPQVLIDPKKQRLILLVSDCISVAWRRQLIHPVLELWGRNGLLTILQLLPERLWERTALGSETLVQLHSISPGVVNSRLIVKPWDEDDIEFKSSSVNVPVITLEPYPLLAWSQVIAGQGNVTTVGFNFDVSEDPQAQRRAVDGELSQPQPEASALVSRFRATASPMARRLAGLMAAAPVSLPVVQLIQQTLLPKSAQIHVAEVFMSGLLHSITPIDQDSNPDYIEYDFKPGVRGLLVDSVPISKTVSVIDKVSEFIANQLGLSVKEFEAYLLKPATAINDDLEPKIRPFAHLKAQVLGRLGGEYARLAEELLISETPTSANPSELKQFSFEVVKVNRKGEIIKRENKQASYFTQDLGNGVDLEMVYIPAGRFLMGSPESERGSNYSERPQHQVTIPPFFLGKYPVTQGQWRAVANLPKINRDLKPDPSSFKGENRPVEQVKWFDAVEFCDRLSDYTGTEYRLPSEAEWEYACRAGTTTPFHYGETITSRLANYDGFHTYAKEAKGEYRRETTPVGDFPPNGFGLYDMHGNVFEWCGDAFHDNYEGAPTDGSLWNNNNHHYYCLRGGSWDGIPWYCRSAYRNLYSARDIMYDDVGFRVARGVGRT